ncbi:hypothetical protein V8C43DRAFT_284457 [Trichoderma afarasin]
MYPSIYPIKLSTSSNDLEPTKLMGTSNASFHDPSIRRIGLEQRCGAKNFFPLLSCSKCDGGWPFAYRELGLGGFCFRWVFVGWTRIRLFCLAAQAALPLALHFLSFLSTSFFCRVGYVVGRSMPVIHCFGVRLNEMGKDGLMG